MAQGAAKPGRRRWYAGLTEAEFAFVEVVRTELHGGGRGAFLVELADDLAAQLRDASPAVARARAVLEAERRAAEEAAAQAGHRPVRLPTLSEFRRAQEALLADPAVAERLAEALRLLDDTGG